METKVGEGRANQGLIDICFAIGLSVKTTAWVIGESTGLVWHEWSVRTGLPTPGDPPPSAIRRREREVQRGWTDDLRQLAEYGCTQRPSSKTVGYRQVERRANQKRYDANRKANQCHSDLIDAKAKASPFPVMTQQMTLSFLSTAFEATA